MASIESQSMVGSIAGLRMHGLYDVATFWLPGQLQALACTHPRLKTSMASASSGICRPWRACCTRSASKRRVSGEMKSYCTKLF